MGMVRNKDNDIKKEYRQVAPCRTDERWKQSKCPFADECLTKWWCVHTMEYYSTIKKNEILPFAMTWMELESIMLSKIIQSEKDKYHIISHIFRI